MKDAPDQGLLAEKGGRGFPYCTIMDASGDVVWEARPSSQAAFDGAVKHAKQLVSLKAELAKSPDDAGLKASVALLDGMGREQRQGPTPAALSEHVKVKGVDASVVAQFKSWRIGAEIMGALRGRDGSTKIYKMYKAGTKIPASFAYPQFYYMYAARGAIAKKDRKVAMEAISTLSTWAEKKKDKRMIKTVSQLKKQAAALPDGEE